jgi:ubiquinone/menaquinone biosynthesis C-methylase UbiE
MKLRLTRRNWNRFAKADPLWAILTAPDKTERRWKMDEFFATGRTTIETQLEWIHRYAPSLRGERALDFGCGVGRLSQALAEHFREVDGVDIAEQMLALAAKHNRHGARVRYLHNTHPDLRLLPSARYDLVFSEITLQHVEPRYARSYLKEFVRVCAPAGVISFQLPAALSPRDAAERFKFTWYPPTLWTRTCRSARRWRERHFPLAPVMEMHAIARAEVEYLLESSGATILAVEPHEAGPLIESYRYLAAKR